MQLSSFLSNYVALSLVLVKATVIFLDTQARNQNRSLVLFLLKSYPVHFCFFFSDHSRSPLPHHYSFS